MCAGLILLLPSFCLVPLLFLHRYSTNPDKNLTLQPVFSGRPLKIIRLFIKTAINEPCCDFGERSHDFHFFFFFCSLLITEVSFEREWNPTVTCYDSCRCLCEQTKSDYVQTFTKTVQTQETPSPDWTQICWFPFVLLWTSQFTVLLYFLDNTFFT